MFSVQNYFTYEIFSLVEWVLPSRSILDLNSIKIDHFDIQFFYEIIFLFPCCGFWLY